MRKALSIVTLVLCISSAGVSRAEPAFSGDIQALTDQNVDFRRVLFTGRNIQIVAMSLRGEEDIGEETHEVDQCFFFVEGVAKVTIEGSTSTAGKDGVVCVPAGIRHNIRNAGRAELKLFTTYAPPQHPPATVHATKAEAQRSEAEHSLPTGK